MSCCDRERRLYKYALVMRKCCVKVHRKCAFNCWNKRRKTHNRGASYPPLTHILTHVTQHYKPWLHSSYFFALTACPNNKKLPSPAMSGRRLVSFGVIDVKVRLKPALHAFLERWAGNRAIGGEMLHSYHAARVRTSGRVRICSLKAVRNDHFALQRHPPPPAPPFVKLKDVPQQIWWPALSFGLVWAKHSSGCGRQCNAVVQGERKAELLDISQGARVENQFPFHHDLSPVPTVVSSTTTSFLSHPHWAASAPLLSLPFFSFFSSRLSTYPSHTFYLDRTERPPPSQTPHQQRDRIPIAHLSSHQLFTPI